jgi:hypothetical protein
MQPVGGMSENCGAYEPCIAAPACPERDKREAAAALSPPMFLTANRTFWPSCLTPRPTSKEIEVDFLSSRTRTTVPSRIKRMIGSPARDRLFQTSQSPFTLRQTRLTTSAVLPARRPRAPPRPWPLMLQPMFKLLSLNRRVHLGHVCPIPLRVNSRQFFVSSSLAQRAWPPALPVSR